MVSLSILLEYIKSQQAALRNWDRVHFRYVKSRSEEQLLSKESEHGITTNACVPEATTPNGDPIVPCGLVAWSLFNDTYKFSINNKDLDVNKKNIAWESDKKHKFGSDVYPKNFQSGGLVGGATLNSSISVSITLMHWCFHF